MQHTSLFSSCLLLCFLFYVASLGPGPADAASAATNGSDDDLSCSPPDLSALRLIADAFPAPLFASNYSHCCGQWNGMVYVTCSKLHRVTELYLVANMVETVELTLFPLAVCRLSALLSLTIMGGSPAVLFGSIPQCIANNLTNLVHLDLSFNSLTGPIPTSFPPSLRFLALNVNHLTGSIPANSFPLSLEHVNLASNGLTGSVPLSFARLRSLSFIDLSGNSLSGSFPAIFANGDVFPHLQILVLNENAISGPIPGTFNTSNLTNMQLSGNSLSGPLPTTWNTPFLTGLELQSNFFSGKISTLFQSSTLTSLQYLQLSSNYLSGEIGDFNPSHFRSITYIDLASNLLQGSFPTSLCSLSNLFYLSVSANSLSGQLNFEHCNFTKLSALLISDNQFSGPFPDHLGSMPNLNAFFLQHNHFNGSLPESWRNLTSLASLALSGNSLIPLKPQGPKLPEWLFNLTSLKSALLIGSLQLQGKDVDLCSSPHGLALQYLDLSNNLLTSDDIACFIGSNLSVSRNFNMSNNPLKLELSNPNAIRVFPLSNGILDLRSSMLGGSLTSLFFEHLATSTIESLYLSHNLLGEQIPKDLGNMSNLVTLDLSFNFFTGVSPLTISKKLSNLNLFLSNNLLEGNLSSMLTCDGSIEQLDLSHNLLTGSIPPLLGQCFPSNTKRLKLNHNHLESFIPNELFASNMESLEILSLSNNHLSGPIPSSFQNLKGLVLIDLSHNTLDGRLDSNVLFSHSSSQHYAKLRILNLGYNNFEGKIPTSLGVIAPSLQVVDLSNNYLIGTIPVHSLQSLWQFHIENQMHGLEAGKGTLYEEIDIIVKGHEDRYQYVIQALTSLDLSNNKLSGPIMSGMGNLSGLVYLNVSRNNLSGPIPSDLGHLGNQLESLDLSYNELVGSIPLSFQNLTQMAIFNVSYNKGLSGPIPGNSPQLQNNESYIGDNGLCGMPILLRSCPADTPYSQPPQPHEDDTSFLGRVANWFDEWIAIPGLALGGVVGFLGSLWALKVVGFL